MPKIMIPDSTRLVSNCIMAISRMAIAQNRHFGDVLSDECSTLVAVIKNGLAKVYPDMTQEHVPADIKTFWRIINYKGKAKDATTPTGTDLSKVNTCRLVTVQRDSNSVQGSSKAG